MIAYEEWKQLQSELENRAKYVFDKLQPILKSYYYEEQKKQGYKGYTYNLDFIDTEETRFSIYIHGEDNTEYFETRLIFLSDEELDQYITSVLEDKKRKEEQERLELERQKIEQQIQRNRQLAYERLRMNG